MHAAGPNGASLLSVLLKRMAGWVGGAAVYLQRCHQITQDGLPSTAYMEGLPPGHHLAIIAQARQALQVKPTHTTTTPPPPLTLLPSPSLPISRSPLGGFSSSAQARQALQ